MSYREQFFALQPPGQALPTDPDTPGHGPADRACCRIKPSA